MGVDTTAEVARHGTPVLTRAAAFSYWLKLGFISVGGSAGQIAITHEELVERRRWISENRFLHAAWRVGSRALKNRWLWAIAAGAFVGGLDGWRSKSRPLVSKPGR